MRLVDKWKLNNSLYVFVVDYYDGVGNEDILFTFNGNGNIISKLSVRVDSDRDLSVPYYTYTDYKSNRCDTITVFKHDVTGPEDKEVDSVTTEVWRIDQNGQILRSDTGIDARQALTPEN